MSDRSPLIDQLDRLASLLRDYNRDEVWLEVQHLHPFVAQQAQVVVTVNDQSGAALRHPERLAPSLTFRLDPECEPVGIGHRFRVAREGCAVRVEHIPAFSGT